MDRAPGAMLVAMEAPTAGGEIVGDRGEARATTLTDCPIFGIHLNPSSATSQN